jgi:hypothetical protein
MALKNRCSICEDIAIESDTPALIALRKWCIISEDLAIESDTPALNELHWGTEASDNFIVEFMNCSEEMMISEDLAIEDCRLQ